MATEPTQPVQVIDTKKITTHIAQRALDRIFDLAEAKIKEKWAQHKNKNKAVFANYIQAQSKRCGLVRTLIYDKQSAHLPDIYVPLRVKVHVGIGRKARYEDKTTEEIIGLLNEEREQKVDVRKTLAGVISGQAGAGKSFFMRNLYINLANSSLSKVPVFLEARELNANSLTDFAGLIAIAFRAAGQELSKEQAAEGLKSGIFLVLIDGFDELRLANERHYAKVLENAAQQFAECPILISGRPSELLHPTYFDQWELLPLERDETIELIRKLDFDEATKASFIALMGKELFESHAEFLEIPLLCVVMFLTYSDAGRISRKKHEFYEDAFNALWSKHDARKQGSYEREKYTGLDKNDFVRLLSAFCASSYVAEHFSMRESDLAHHLLSAKKLTDVVAKEEDFVRDMTISTSLLVLEGNTYRFSHRSFQEYFCARYVLCLSDAEITNGIDVVSNRYGTDSVLDFVRSINSERFEAAWVVPKLSALLSRLQKAAESFRRYDQLFSSAEGEFLRKLRDIYVMKPSSEGLSGAVAAWRDMKLVQTQPLQQLKEPQAKLFLKDISNFEGLLERLTERHTARAVMREALFGARGQ